MGAIFKKQKQMEGCRLPAMSFESTIFCSKQRMFLAILFVLFCIEASAKMRDGVQEAFEEVVARILQTPELWHVKREEVKLAENHGLKEAEACSGAYCSLA